MSIINSKGLLLKGEDRKIKNVGKEIAIQILGKRTQAFAKTRSKNEDNHTKSWHSK